MACREHRLQDPAYARVTAALSDPSSDAGRELLGRLESVAESGVIGDDHGLEPLNLYPVALIGLQFRRCENLDVLGCEQPGLLESRDQACYTLLDGPAVDGAV